MSSWFVATIILTIATTTAATGAVLYIIKRACLMVLEEHCLLLSQQQFNKNGKVRLHFKESPDVEHILEAFISFLAKVVVSIPFTDLLEFATKNCHQ